jgi:hypothetical protein
VQVILHQHPVNAERRARGLPPVNSLWLWGGGPLPQRVNNAVVGRHRRRPPSFGAGEACWHSGSGTRRSIGECSRCPGWLIDLQDQNGRRHRRNMVAVCCKALAKRQPLKLSFASGERGCIARGIAAFLAARRSMSALQLRRRPLLGEPAGWGDSLHPLLQRIYAARGVFGPEQAEHRLNRLLSPQQLGGIEQRCRSVGGSDTRRCVHHHRRRLRLRWRNRYRGSQCADCGCWARKRVDYVVPNRFVHGYGLTPELVASLPSHMHNLS